MVSLHSALGDQPVEGHVGDKHSARVSELLTFIVPESKRLNYQVAFRSVRTNTEQTLQKNSVHQPRCSASHT